MKQIIVGLFIITIVITFINGNSNEVIIPDDSIRFRIIANSNEVEDQIEKHDVVNEISTILYEIEESSNDINSSRISIENAIPKIESKLESLGFTHDINFGNNYFPEKNYKGITYDEGNYESLVITLGEGEGDNWWCILFPPLCQVDVNSNDLTDIEYSLYIKNIINKVN